MNEPKSIFASKTIWVNTLTLLVGLATLLLDLPVISENPMAVAIITVVVVPLLNSILRLVTNKPVGLNMNMDWT